MPSRPPFGPPVVRVRVAGPALVLVLGPGAEQAARVAFEAEELPLDPFRRLESGLLAAVPLDDPDPDAVCALVETARGADRPVDVVVLGDAPLPAAAFRAVTRVPPVAGVVLSVERVAGAFDRRDLAGPFDVIGDVHGCLEELLLLLDRLGYALRYDALGRPVGARHEHGRTVVLLGDLVNRGPDVVGVLRLVLGMLAAGEALAVLGNHDDALRRALERAVLGGGDGHVDGGGGDRPSGLDASLEQLDREPEAFRAEVLQALAALPPHLLLDGGRLVVAHAGLPERYHGRESARVRALCLHGPTTGATDEFGLPDREPWAQDYRGAATVAYGHTPSADREWVNGTVRLDGGCVFGGALVALRYPEQVLVEVPAVAAHSAPARPFLPAR